MLLELRAMLELDIELLNKEELVDELLELVTTSTLLEVCPRLIVALEKLADELPLPPPEPPQPIKPSSASGNNALDNDRLICCVILMCLPQYCLIEPGKSCHEYEQ